jgi:mycothiol synthase
VFVFQVVPFAPGRAGAEDWRRYHAFRRARQRESRPEEPVAPDQVVEAELQQSRRFEAHYWFEVSVDGEMAGFLAASAVLPTSPEYETNRHLLWGEGWVLEPYRRCGIGRAFLPALARVMDEHGATVLSSPAELPSGHHFLRWLGAEPRLVSRQSRLDLTTVDWAMVEAWVREGQERSPRSRLEFYPGRLPESRLEEVSAVVTRLMNVVPTEQLDRGEFAVWPDAMREWYQLLDVRGAEHHTLVVRDPDGSIVAVTDVTRSPHDGPYLRQQLTGVMPEAQGRGLGKWVKAAMLGHIRQRHPDVRYITTENAGSNAPMLAINVRLGFRPYREIVTYQISRETLAGRIPPS